MRKALYAVAKTVESGYRLRRALGVVIQILVIWAIFMLLYYIVFELMAALTF